jgi:hypothetical protein
MSREIRERWGGTRRRRRGVPLQRGRWSRPAPGQRDGQAATPAHMPRRSTACKPSQETEANERNALIISAARERHN